MNLKIFSLLLFLSLLISNAQGSEKYHTSDGIGSQLEKYSSVVSPQKVYLHLDKSSYSAGQTICFKAYIFDGTDNKPYEDSTNVYVDLIGSDGKPLARRILLAGDGWANGDILLGSDIPEGNMNIRVPLYPGFPNLLFMIEGAGYDGGLGFSMFTIELQ